MKKPLPIQLCFRVEEIVKTATSDKPPLIIAHTILLNTPSGAKIKILGDLSHKLGQYILLKQDMDWK